MPLFSRSKNKGAQAASKTTAQTNGDHGYVSTPAKPRFVSNWNSQYIEPEEVEELIHACTAEMKSRAEALDTPFLLLPFRPASDASGARTFITNFFKANQNGSNQYRRSNLQQELRLTEPVVLCSILKWCWSRMPGGVVTWQVYDGFQIGEKEANYARNAFETFLPIVVDSAARKSIIFDFYDLLSAVAAHGKMNGLGGRKLSRLAGWWAFEHTDDGKGFTGGYRSWTAAADASTHLFFAYLRTLSPEEHPSMSLIERIPRSLQALLASTEYPPATPNMMQRATPKVVMIVDSVSPTPFALLRRAKHFEYRANDRVLRRYSEFDDPVQALTEECKRVLYAISNVNSASIEAGPGHAAKRDESWTSFLNTGFADIDEKKLANGNDHVNGAATKPRMQDGRVQPRSRDVARPTTPSWADFMSGGFVEDDKTTTTLLLPPDHILPPLSHTNTAVIDDGDVAPGELAAIANVELDETFWWVWMTSLAGEEPVERKAVFGRCTVVETTFMGGKWLVMEEQLKGAEPEPVEDMYLAKKKGMFSFSKRGRRPSEKAAPPVPRSLAPLASPTPSKRSLAPDQQSRIRQAAAALKSQESVGEDLNTRRGRRDEETSRRTNSVLTIGLQSEASPAMKWASAYDKSAIRAQYLGDPLSGLGSSKDDLTTREPRTFGDDGYDSDLKIPARTLSPNMPTFPVDDTSRDLPPVPKADYSAPVESRAKPATYTPTRPTHAVAVGTSPDDRNDYSPQLTPARSTFPVDKELAVDPPRSPHPAYRSNESEPASPVPQPTPQSPAMLAAQRAMVSNGVSNTGSGITSDNQAKLRKQASNSGGIKKLFGRKKIDPARPSMEGGAYSNNGSLTPPVEPPARRISVLRKKVPAPRAVEPMPIVTTPTAPPTELPAEPVTSPSFNTEQDTPADNSPIDPQDTRDAEQEFARFDQDSPESIAEEVPSQAAPEEPQIAAPRAPEPDLVAPQAQRAFNLNTALASRIAPNEANRDSLVHYGGPEDEAPSEASVDEHPEPALESKDRWAVIRENAARRAAARASEEQSARSQPSQSVRSDDGETSGEETIESRVARIKARVAELTGGMEAAPRN